jgi:hypothetical protein
MYSLQPEQFVLQRLFAPPAGDSLLTSFQGTLFFGHLERVKDRRANILPGLDNVIVRVNRLVYAHEFSPDDVSFEDLEYILFGKEDELFLALLIATPADFDQVLPVRVVDAHFSDQELRRGIRIVVPQRPNTASDRLREERQRVPAQVKTEAASPGNKREILIEPNREIYFEESELRTLPIFGQTMLEREAGF